MPPSKFSHPESGYSLVELTVVLILLGLIAVAIAGGLRFGTRIWEATDRSARSLDDARIVERVLRTTLAAAATSPPPATGRQTEALLGQPRRISFYAPPLDALRPNGLLEYEIAFSGHALMLRWRGADGEGSWHETVLADQLNDAAFAFRNDQMGPNQWSADWSGAARRPDLVRLRLESATSTPSQSQDIIVRLRIDHTADCIFDPVSFGCRS